MALGSNSDKNRWFCLLFLSLIAVSGGAGQNPLTAVSKPQPNLVDNIARPLRYTPDGQDFVVENGGEFFNRPLYGGNTAFRADAGDQPEFSLYLPGHGGNLRFGIKTSSGAKWLHEAARITARYRPGTMLYEIRDPLLGARAVLRLHAIALHQTDGLAVRVEAEGLAAPIELIVAYGGLGGKRGVRDGDIGTEAVPSGSISNSSPSHAWTTGSRLAPRPAVRLRCGQSCDHRRPGAARSGDGHRGRPAMGATRCPARLRRPNRPQSGSGGCHREDPHPCVRQNRAAFLRSVACTRSRRARRGRRTRNLPRRHRRPSWRRA